MATKKKAPQESQAMETRRRMTAIRKLCSTYPPATADARLETIADLATGKTDPSKHMNAPSPTLGQRLADGAASRSPRMVSRKETVAERKRRERGGRDRMEGGAMDRTTDVNV